MRDPASGAQRRGRTSSLALALLGALLLAALVLALLPRGARSADSRFAEHAVATSGGAPFLIAKGPDGRLWYTLAAGGLEAMTSSGTPTAYPDATTGGGGTGIAAASNDTLAVLEGDAANSPHGSVSEVGTNGSVAHGPFPTDEEPNQIAEGPNGYLYWTTNSTVCQATAAGLANYSCIPLDNGANVGGDGIAAGPDGALWLAERTNNEIYRVTTAGDHTDYPLPHDQSNPSGITAGPDGALWFTEVVGNRIGRIATDGTITEYGIPTANADPTGITQGPDGALWFTESAANKIGRITTAGTITEYDIPTANAGPQGIVTGPDGKLWFTEQNAGQIGVFDPTEAPPPPPPAKQPEAAVTASTMTPTAGRLLTLDPTSSIAGTGRITRFAYDFDGSGTYKALCPPAAPIAYKIFDTPGSHVVGMRVTDAAGAVATTHVGITALAPPLGSQKARAATNPALAGISHFWCGGSVFSSRLNLGAFLPRTFTSDVRAVGVDVTQGVVPDPPRPLSLSTVAAGLAAKYFGIRARPRAGATFFRLNNDEQDPRDNRITWLQRYGATVVRVYAAAQLAPNGTDVPNVQMKLYGFRDGHELPGSPLLSQTGPLDVKLGPPFTTHAMRVGYSPVDGTLPAFTYTLPHDWVDSPGNVAMLAVPTLVGARLDRQCSTLDCKLNQQAGSGDFQFSDTGLLIVRSVAMTVAGDPALPSPGTVFDTAANLSPVAVLASPYQGTVDISPITGACPPTDKSQPCTDPNGWVTGQIGTWAANNQIGTPGTIRYATIGIHKGHGNAQGYSSWPGSCTDNSTWGGAICESETNNPVSQVEVNRPYTSVAHEMFHDLGRPHADDSTSGCGGNGEGKPDAKGDLESIALDRHANSGGSVTNPYLIRSPGLPSQPASLFDVMSYCANNAGDPDSWFSAHNWDEVAGEWIFFLKRAAASSVRAAGGATAVPRATGPALQVTGVVEPDRTTITQVAPASRGTTRAVASSPVHAVARNAAGHVVGDAALSVTTGHLDSGHTGTPATPVIAFNGTVPAAGADRLQILSGGVPVATRTRSAHAPKVRLLTPKRGKIGAKKTVTVRWKASDADHGPLFTNVDYSADKGRHWHAVYTTNRAVHSARIPSRYLTGAKNARLRVRVSDGFNQTAATSGRLRVAGRPPSVTIDSPSRGQRFYSDASVYLQGSAFNDAFAMIGDKRLTWYAGKRKLGHGASLSARGLPPGKVRLRLVAVSHGRRGSAAVVVRVSAARPFFTTLTAPRKVARTARHLRLKVATNVAATLRAGGKRYKIGRHGKAIRVKVKPGHKTLKLGLRLVAHGRHARQTLAVPRG